jgi:hypothetical protein
MVSASMYSPLYSALLFLLDMMEWGVFLGDFVLLLLEEGVLEIVLYT